MLKAIVNFLNLKLELLNYFDLTRCLCELKRKGDVVAPKEYVSGGEWQNIDFDSSDGVSYWRLRDTISVTRETNPNKALKRVQTTVPLKLVFSVRRDKLTTDDAYSFDRIRQTIVKQFNIDNGALTTALGAAKVTITAPSSDGDPLSVWEDETDGTGKQEPDFKYVFGSIDIDIVIDSDTDCLATECDDVDSDILHTFDFCDAAVRDRLTPEQVTCLEDALCGVCADATVQLNGSTIGTIASGATGDFPVNLDGSPSGVWDGTAWQVTSAPCADATVELNGVEMVDIPSGDTENILVLQSDDMTQVGSKQGTHFRIDDSAISINGSPVADVKAEDPLDIDVTQEGSPVGSWNGSAWIVPPCADGTVENSDQTVSVTVASGGTETFPDTPISANSDLVINQPSGVAKDLVVRYETQGVAPTTIVSGEIVVPDSFAPDPNRNPFTGNYGIGSNGVTPNTGFKADGYGCFNNLRAWSTEPATSQDCTVEYYCGTLFGNSCYLGFTQVLTSLTILGNGFTGIFNNGSSLGYFYANSVYIGTFYNPSTVGDVIKITWNATDKKFRLYVAGVLTYTSTYTYSGSPYPAVGANAGLQPVAGCFVTRLD